MNSPEFCLICSKEIKDDDWCASDIELGVCHFECLDGSPVVDLDTGEEIEGGVLDKYQYKDLFEDGE